MCPLVFCNVEDIQMSKIYLVTLALKLEIYLVTQALKLEIYLVTLAL